MTDQNTNPAVDSSASSLLPAGRQLRNAREALELTAEQVAQQLKLSVRQVNAIEQEAFDELPSNLFIRGFVRNYARLLKIDAEPLLNYLAEVLPREQEASLVSDATVAQGVILADKPTSQGRSFSPAALMALLGAAIGIGVAFWFLQQPSNPELALPEVESPPVVDVPVASAVAENASVPEVTAVPASSVLAVNVASQAASAVASKAAVAAVSSAPSQASAVVAVVSGPIRIVSTTDSWVQIIDANGNKVLSEIIRPGVERNVDGKPPFAVKIGNAPKTQLYFNGQSVDLGPYLKTGSDVVNLELK